MAKNKTAAKPKKQSYLTKKDMVDYMGPVFEELKTDGRILKASIDSKTHRLEVLMESMEQKILGALRPSLPFRQK